MNTFREKRMKYFNITLIFFFAILGAIFLLPPPQNSNAACNYPGYDPEDCVTCDCEWLNLAPLLVICERTNANVVAWGGTVNEVPECCEDETPSLGLTINIHCVEGVLEPDDGISWEEIGPFEPVIGDFVPCSGEKPFYVRITKPGKYRVIATISEICIETQYIDACCQPGWKEKISDPPDAWSEDNLPFASSLWGQMVQYLLNSQIAGSLDLGDMRKDFAQYYFIKCCEDGSTGIYKYDSERDIGHGKYSITAFDDPINTVIGNILASIEPLLRSLGIYDQVKTKLESKVPSATGLSFNLGASVNDWESTESDDCICPEPSVCKTGVNKAWAGGRVGSIKIPIHPIGDLEVEFLVVNAILTWKGYRVGNDNITEKYGTGYIKSGYRLPGKKWKVLDIVEERSWPDPPVSNTNKLCM
jgi:hypothetical protein